MTVGNERRECLLNKLLRWYNAFNRITRSFDWNFRFCSYLCSVLEMGASMRITTAYLNSSQVDAMQPRQPATQYEHKKSTFYTILLQSNAFVYALSLVWFSRFHHIIEFWAVSCSFFSALVSFRFVFGWWNSMVIPRQVKLLFTRRSQPLYYTFKSFHFPWHKCCKNDILSKCNVNKYSSTNARYSFI